MVPVPSCPLARSEPPQCPEDRDMRQALGGAPPEYDENDDEWLAEQLLVVNDLCDVDDMLTYACLHGKEHTLDALLEIAGPLQVKAAIQALRHIFVFHVPCARRARMAKRVAKSVVKGQTAPTWVLKWVSTMVKWYTVYGYTGSQLIWHT